MSRAPETAFLPAALEVQETPPAPAARAIIAVILLFFVTALAWAALGEVDVVAVAHGSIIPSGHSKIVQPLEKGMVKRIRVAEGQLVQSGEVLLELDAGAVRADLVRLEQEVGGLSADIRRAGQLTSWLNNDTGPQRHSGTGTADELLVGQRREFDDRMGVLERELERQLAEQQSAQQQLEKLQAILPIISRRAKDRKGLAAQKLLPEQQFLEIEQERLELAHDLRSQQAIVDEHRAGVSELRARIKLGHSEFLRGVLEHREEAERQKAVAEQELVKVQARLDAHRIRAPVDGVIQQLAIHNVGAIVTPAQQLMVIVPQDAALEVVAILENKDIGFVKVGQAAEIKIDTFPFTKYGTIAGKVMDLSDDAVSDDNKGLVYRMRVAIDQTEVRVNGQQVPLSPGMTVTVESKTGSRRLIEFFLSPLLRYADESARER